MSLNTADQFRICKECGRQCKSMLSLKAHLRRGHGIDHKLYLIKYFYAGKHPLCKCGCGKKVSYVRGVFKEYIRGHYLKLNKYLYSDEINKKRRKTNMKKFGGVSPLCSQSVRDKVKRTNIEKYGVENSFSSEVFRQKARKTNLEKYGVENAIQNEDIFNKSRKTCLEKYGTEYPAKLKLLDREEIICDTCTKHFFVPHSLIAVRKYCSMKCRKIAERVSKIELTCTICGDKYEIYKSQLKRTNSRFCSRECRYLGREIVQCLTCGIKFEADVLQERKYCSTKCSNLGSFGRIPWNKGLTKETSDIVRLGSEKSHKTKKRLGLYDNALDNLHTSWGKTGRYFFKKQNKEVFYRSSWELAFMQHLDANDSIQTCRYEPLRIAYFNPENEQRNYIPDFLVEYVDGTKVLYEIKPNCFIDTPVNVCKFNAAEKYCAENNLTFKVITEIYLKQLGIL